MGEIIKKSILKLIEGRDLSRSEMGEAMREIMEGAATEAQIGAWITALRIKGETVEEITGAAEILRERCVRIRADEKSTVDLCGTGGDGAGTFNISTTAAFVAAGAGVLVAKHGNRAVSSSSGSADLLKALGVNTDIPPEIVEKCLKEIGIGFLFAPALHPAMKYAAGPRREVGVRSIFNILGPLSNPAGAKAQVVGVYKKELTSPVAHALRNLGACRVFVVHGLDGLDEITLASETQVSELSQGKIETYTIRPEDFGLARCAPEDMAGGSPDDNAGITRRILGGEKGPRRDVSLLNAAAAIAAGGKVTDIREGMRLAGESIDSGEAMRKLEGLIQLTNL